MPGTRRRTLRKPHAAKRARWYASRGYPVSFIAQKLKVSRDAVRSWCDRYMDSRAFDRLVAKCKRLSPVQRRALIDRINVELTP